MNKKEKTIWYFILGIVILGLGIIQLLHFLPLYVLLLIFVFAIVVAILGYYLESKHKKRS